MAVEVILRDDVPHLGKIGSRPADPGAQLGIVLLPPRRVRQHVDRFSEVLKLPLGLALVRTGVAIGMVFASELAKALPNLPFGGRPVDAEDLVIVDFHSGLTFCSAAGKACGTWSGRLH